MSTTTRKVCLYRDCDSSAGPEKYCPYTFFQFPKDAERLKLWEQLSQCRKVDPKRIKYLCSKHFSERKYIANNSRRKLLLANAVPFPYTPVTDRSQPAYEDDGDHDVMEAENLVESTQFEGVADLNTDEQDSHEEEEFEENEYQYVETTMLNEYEDQENEELYEFPEKDYKSNKKASEIEEAAPSTSSNKNLRKHKPDSAGNTIQHGLLKMQKLTTTEPETQQKLKDTLKTNRYLENKNMNAAKIQQNSNEKTKDIIIQAELETSEDADLLHESSTAATELGTLDPDVTTFIFKGEEYIQMPKGIYLEEKLELIKELNYYKEIVEQMKSLLSNAKV